MKKILEIIQKWFRHNCQNQPKDQITDNREGVFSKRDLCLKCGHTWVMFVQHIKFDNPVEDGATQ